MCHNNINKKSLKYYLELESKQNNSLDYEKNINKFVDYATKNINQSEKLAMYSILKNVIQKIGCKKKDIINKISQMYKDEEIDKITNSSPLTKQTLKQFRTLDEEERKSIIIKWIDSLNILDFGMLKNKENIEININNDIAKIIEKDEEIYIEYTYNDKTKRLLFFFDNGTIIAINVKNEQCISKIKKIKKENIKYLKDFFLNNEFDTLNTNGNITININGTSIFGNQYLFYIILVLLKEKGQLEDKIFFDYESYFKFDFNHELRMLHRDERENLFIFAEWCPDENENLKIVDECKNITSKIDVEIQDTDITKLYYFAKYYKNNKDYNKAISLFEKITKNGIDYANAEIAQIYNSLNDKQKEMEYLEKSNDFINIYKKITAKKCYEIKVLNKFEVPNIKDSKMYGMPYLPIGEKYPISKNGKNLNLLIQINLSEINLEGYPNEGILQIYTEPNSINPEIQIRYYKDVFCSYQTELPEPEEWKFWGDFTSMNAKLCLQESYTYMPLIDNKIESVIKRTIKDYNEFIGIKLLKYDDSTTDVLWYLINNKIKFQPLILGGYADYCNTDYHTSTSKECLLKLMTNFETGDNYCVNVLISKKDLENEDFTKAEIIFED